MIRRTATGLVLLLLVLPRPGRAQDAEPGRFRVERVSGPPITGVVEKVKPDGTIVFADNQPSTVPGPDVVALRRQGARLPARPTGEQIVFANGDQVPGVLVGLVGERLRFRAALGGTEMEVPLAVVSALWLAAPEGGEDLAGLRRRWASERRLGDRVLLRNGDVFEGSLLGLEEKTLRIEVRRKEVRVERSRVAAVALNSTLISFPIRPGPYIHLVMANGTRLALASAECRDGRELAVKTLFGASVQVRMNEVVALDVRQGSAVYLADLKPRAYEQTPYLDLSWPFVTDGSVSGRDLCLEGNTYDKGLGVHAESRLTYDLSAGCRFFEAVVGFDDGNRLRDGDVRIRILLDGKQQDLGWDGRLTATGPAHVLRIPVANARQLTLSVEFGRRGGVNGRIDWADARLLK
jgi:hypothetical protein